MFLKFYQSVPCSRCLLFKVELDGVWKCSPSTRQHFMNLNIHYPLSMRGVSRGHYRIPFFSKRRHFICVWYYKLVCSIKINVVLFLRRFYSCPHKLIVALPSTYIYWMYASIGPLSHQFKDFQSQITGCNKDFHFSQTILISLTSQR
jgi:hypothetical protein